MGYTENHTKGTYHILNLKTNQVVLSTCVSFLKKSYGDWAQVKNPAIIDVRDEDEENLEPEAEFMKDDQLDDVAEPPIITLEKIPELEEQNGPNFISDNEEDETEPNPQQVQARPNQKTCLRNELKNLATSYNHKANRELEGLRDRANLILELSEIADTHSIAKSNKVNEDEPQSFEEAYNHPDKAQREKWRNAIKRDFHDINKRGDWRIIKKSKIPADRRCVKFKWIFKIKINQNF